MIEPTGRYDADYYAGLTASGTASAAVIAPLLMERYRPPSFLDVGCGGGYFLDAFQQFGVSERQGVDGPFNDGRTFGATATISPPSISRPNGST